MTAQFTKAIWTRSQQRGAALLLLLALASYTNRQGLAWPKLARRARMSRRYVTQLLRLLVEWEVIARRREPPQPFRLRHRLERLAVQLPAEPPPRSRRQVEPQPLQHRLSAQQRERRRRLHEQLRRRFRLPRLSLFTVEPPEESDR